MNKQIVGRVQHKHDIEANWLKAENFIPLEGELIIYDADNNNSAPRFKVGDGETVVSALPFTVAEANLDSANFAYFEEDGTEYIDSAVSIDADSLGGIPASSYSTTSQIEAQYVKASIEEVVMGEVAMNKADFADKATEADKAVEADKAIEADNASKIENKTINELFTAWFEVDHPVGSLYFSTSNTDDPNTKWAVFGVMCEWKLVPDVFLLGAGGSYELGAIGGEAEHTLTIDEMPPSRLTLDSGIGTKYYGYMDGVMPTSSSGGLWGGVVDGSSESDVVRTQGGSQPHNNMPPFLSTNIWKRIS